MHFAGCFFEDHPFSKAASKSWQGISLGEVATYPMELHVEAAGIADGLALGIPAPQGGGRGVAVGTGQAHPPRRRLETNTGKHGYKQVGSRE